MPKPYQKKQCVDVVYGRRHTPCDMRLTLGPERSDVEVSFLTVSFSTFCLSLKQTHLYVHALFAGVRGGLNDGTVCVALRFGGIAVTWYDAASHFYLTCFVVIFVVWEFCFEQ